MIDVPTLRADDTEEFEVIVSEREGRRPRGTLRVDGAEMNLVFSEDRFNVVRETLLTYRTSKKPVAILSNPHEANTDK